ncbi:DUF5615 family PIN-like protein [Rubrivirga sp. IMCC45206]|uniref:DUF5615 family PIN-like protein n=1 Tax=Rubrivirga sp. IMCC45206 TaxID=3391614 RepID=UPI0039902FD3
MTLYLDAHLSPSLARWITATFDGVEASSAEYLGLRDATDPEIAEAARLAGAIVLTKDQTFVREAARAQSPPMIRVASGNASTTSLKPVLLSELPAALDAIRDGALTAVVGGAGDA